MSNHETSVTTDRIYQLKLNSGQMRRLTEKQMHIDKRTGDIEISLIQAGPMSLVEAFQTGVHSTMGSISLL